AAGRLAAAAVVVGGITALLVALASEASAIARAGFFTQGLVWLALLGAAVIAIRSGDRQRHAALMSAMAAVASGAVLLRLVMAASVSAGLPFAVTYGAASWLCWIMPLGLVAALVRARWFSAHTMKVCGLRRGASGGRGGTPTSCAQHKAAGSLS